MTRDELTAAIQRLADAPHGGFPQRRKGMPVDVAQDILNAVLDVVLEVARPRLERDYGGSEVLQALYGLRGGRQTSNVGPGASNGTKNGARHG